jgi:hypothetical protein
MNASRLLLGIALVAIALSFSCLDERVVAPEEPLPPVLAIDRPTVHLFRYARGRKIEADTVRISNNGEGTLGAVDMIGGVDYLTTNRVGWLQAVVENLSDEEALLILLPTYAEEEQSIPDSAEVVLKAEGSSDLKRVEVIARTLRGAVFEFSVSPVAFSAFPGDPADSISLTVRNGGNGTLWIRPPTVRYHEGQATGWLSVESFEDKALAPVYLVKADPGSQGGGDLSAHLVFETLPSDTAQAKPDSVRVLLNVARPVLSASADTVAFSYIIGGEEPRPDTIPLQNSGAGDFGALGDLEIEEPDYGGEAGGWLTVSPLEEAITLAATPGSLRADTFYATVRMSSTHGGKDSVEVSLVVGDPVLTLKPRTASFGLVEGAGAPPPPAYVAIANTGSGTFEALGPISLDPLVPTASWVRAEMDGDTIILEPTAGALALGDEDYTTSLPVRSANGGSDTVRITLSVSPGLDPPNLTLSAAAAEFSTLPGYTLQDLEEKEINIWNSGGGTLADLGGLRLEPIVWGDAEEDWLFAELTGATLTLSVIRADLGAGTYSATVTVSSRSGGSPEDVGVTFKVGAPQLTLSSLSASFSGEEGETSDLSYSTIDISNTGAGKFSDLGSIHDPSVSPGADWLEATLAPNGRGVDLTANIGDLTASSSPYAATVNVTSDNDAGGETIDVRLTVYPKPLDAILGLSASSVHFYTEEEVDPDPQEITVFNEGGGGMAGLGTVGVDPDDITWLEGPEGWLSAGWADPTVELSVDSHGLTAADGPCTAIVPVTSTEAADASIQVTLTLSAVEDPPADPVLKVSPASVHLDAPRGSIPLAVDVEIYNGGGGGIAGLGSLGVDNADIDWGVGPEGWLSATLDGTTVTLSVEEAGLTDADTYTATVPATSTTATGASISVTLNLGTPDLTLSSESASLSEGDPTADITISNTGAGDFGDLEGITCADDRDWLSATRAGQTLTLSADTDGLTADESPYTGTVTVSSENGGEDEEVLVTLTIAPTQLGPVLRLSPATLRFYAIVGTGETAWQTVAALNFGGGSLGAISVGPPEYLIGEGGWLSHSTPDGMTFSVRADAGSLAAGTHTATLPVTSSGVGTEEIAITFVVGMSSLTVSPRTLSFGDTEGGAGPDPKMVAITNTGGGSLESLGAITLGETEYGEGATDWLEATIVSPDSIRVRAITTDLPSRTEAYEARMEVRSTSGGNDEVSVELSVSPGNRAPEFSLSRASLTFEGIYGGESPDAQSVTASNTGGGSLGILTVGDINYYTGSQGWLDGEGSLGIDGLTVTLQPRLDFGAVTTDTSRAVLAMTSESQGESLQASLEVAWILSRPALSLSTETVTFSDLVGTRDTLSTQVFIKNAGAGNQASLGGIHLDPIRYTLGEPGWLSAALEEGEGELPRITVNGTAAHLQEGQQTAEVPVVSEYGGTETLAVTLAVRTPDFSFEKQIIQFVIADSLVEGRPVPLPGDSVLVVAESSDTMVARVGVRNGSETPLSLVGLRVGTPAYPTGQEGGWITGAFLDRTTASFYEPAELVVVVEPRGLSSGVYEGYVTITAERSGLEPVDPKDLRVFLVVN